MCGIVGVMNLTEPGPPIDGGVLGAMAGRVRHRGPDDSGQAICDGAGLGFVRLSIVDLGGGNQPHTNEDGTILSVCNGEIYNYQELRREVTARGHRLRSSCDVEVLVHLYEEEGPGFLGRLNGQFALAIYDRNRRELLLARDQTGIAPLFYTTVRGQLLFASEIKALLAHPGVRRGVDLTGLDQVLTFPGLVSPVTMFSDIRGLPPGNMVRVRRGRVEVAEYWDLVYPEAADLDDTGDEAEYVERLSAALDRSVRYRLQADVPVGFYLSGGLDSSLIAAAVHRLRPAERFHSFSVGFPDPAIDERRYQRLMAEQVGSIHHEIEMTQEDILSDLRAIVVHAEAPLKESYNTCSLRLSRLVRESGLKVVLTGEGADELFAGYVGYRFGRRAENRTDPLDPSELMERQIRRTLWGDPDLFYERDFLPHGETKLALYSEELAADLDRFDSTRGPIVDGAKLRGRHPIHQRSYLDFKLRLSDHLVADHGDRVAYANSVEARYPFLDVELIDFLRTVPPRLLVNGPTEKHLLRQVARARVPEAIRNREKFGFVAHGSPWILRRNVDWVEDLLSDATIRRQGFFNPATVRRLRDIYAADGFYIDTRFETDIIMIIITFGIFLEEFGLSRT